MRPTTLALAFLAFTTVTQSAKTAMIDYNTIGSNFSAIGYTGGSGTSTLVYQQGGDTVILAFMPVLSSVNTPTNIVYGYLTQSYIGNPADTISLPQFQLNLIINDLTCLCTKQIVGTAGASTVSANNSNLLINWSPTSIDDPANVVFTIYSPTPLPVNNALSGQATLLGTVTGDCAAPEPGSLFLLGAGLTGLAYLGRRKLAAGVLCSAA